MSGAIGRVWREACLDGLASRGVRIAGSSFAFGSPADRIVRREVELDADIIVMGAGERREREAFAAGPIATAVTQHARQPVRFGRRDQRDLSAMVRLGADGYLIAVSDNCRWSETHMSWA